MSNIINFNFESNEIRTVVCENGNPLFHATDLATALNFKNPRQAISSHIDTEDLVKIEITTKGGTQKASFTNESGMYALIFGSTKDEAKKFKRWVTSEVLPSIRKTGQYTAPRQTLSPKEQKALADKVRSLCQHDKKAYSGVWRAIKDHFGVERYQDILASDFENALAFLDTIAPPSPTDHPFFLTQNMAREFSARLKHIFDLAELVGDNKPAHLMKIRVKELHSFLYEYQKQHYPNALPALP